MRAVSDAARSFVHLIRERTGNVVPRARYDFLDELLERRARVAEQPDKGTYVRRLATGDLLEEWRQLIPLVTIKESYFFRAPQQFRVLQRTILPELVKAHAARRRLRIWSAACARGEEPGTLALVLAESGLLGNWDWEILATDVDEDALEAARRGIYGERSVAQVPAPAREKWFTPRGKLFELSPVLRARIRYKTLNLAEAPRGFPDEGFDLIFLRNVLIYFPRPLQRRVVTQVAERLPEDGYMFLGASETLWQIQDDLVPRDLGVCFAYHHPKPGEEMPPPRKRPEDRPPVDRPPRPDRPSLLPDPFRPATRLRSRDEATQEVDEPPIKAPTPEEPEEPPAAHGDDELRDDLVDLEGPGPTLPCGVQERLTDAARELAANRMEAAESILQEVLEADPSEPAAHALEGFLRDLQDRTDDAVTSYRAALYLDPSLFQVRLLLADCLRRIGAETRARKHYQEVLATVKDGRELVTLEDLPLPNRVRAEKRCRQVLRSRR